MVLVGGSARGIVSDGLDSSDLLLAPVCHTSADLQGKLDHAVDGLLNVIQARDHHLWEAAGCV